MLEGFHAIKHALRFGAEVLDVAAVDPDELTDLAERLAPDAAATLRRRAHPIAPADFAALVPVEPAGRVVAVARRPASAIESRLADAAAGAPIVLLDEPRHLGNVGAAIRVAAAAGADGVAVTGTADPWHPHAVRGAAGLQYALAVGRIDSLAPIARPLVALDPAGDPLAPDRVPPGAVLAFGSERHGLGEDVRAAAVATLSLPMRDGVSSINLAAAVAAALYVVRLGRA